MKKISFFIVFIFIFEWAPAQKPNLLFEQITDKSGRSLGFITGIVQDTVGFMWFATRSGLVRYDGFDYKLFKHQSKDSSSLPYNDITYLYYDRNNIMWMRHYDQYTAFKNEKRHIPPVPVSSNHFDLEARLVQDAGDNIWIGPSKNGILKYNNQTGKAEFYKNYLPQYHPDLIEKTKKLIPSARLAALINMGNNCDSTVVFTVSKPINVLVIGLGEGYHKTFYDFGYITDEKNKTIWTLTCSESRYPGGDEKNRLQINILKLAKGKYTIHYKTDDANTWNNWTDEPQPLFDFYGIYCIELPGGTNLGEYNELLRPFYPSNTIKNDQVRDMIVDKNGNMVFITDSSLCRFNIKQNQFENYPIPFQKVFQTQTPSQFYTLYQDRKGIFWIGSSNGLAQFDLEKNIYITYRNQKQGDTLLTSNVVFTIYEDSDGLIWIGTDNGINLLDRKKNTVYKYFPDNRNRLYDRRIIKFYEDHSGNLWVATFEGLNRLKKSKFRFHDLETLKYSQFPVLYDSRNQLWFHGSDEYLQCYSLQTRQMKRYKLEKKIFAFNDEYNEYDYMINDLLSENDHLIWLAIDNGLYCFEANASKIVSRSNIKAVIVNNDSIKNQLRWLLQDNYGNIWGIAIDGLYSFSKLSGRRNAFVPFHVKYESIFEVDRKYIKHAISSKNGYLWFRATDGIYRFDPVSREMKQVYKFDSEVIQGSVSEGNIFEDKSGIIWFSSLPDLMNIIPSTLQVNRYKIENASDVGLCNVTADDDGLIWIYTNNGLYSFDSGTKISKKYTNDEGLADNNINGIFDDRQGHIWITTIKGLTRFDKTDGQMMSFFRPDDFESHTFLMASDRLLQNLNEMLFFTTKGIVTFNPDNTNRYLPPVVITRFTIFGREFETDSIIYQKKYIELKYNQNFLAFEFSALDFTDPSKNQFMFFLEGLDKEWSLRDASDRKATYTGIQPGKYTLLIKASNNDKIWNEKGTRLSIIIKPPWYKTTVAYILYVVVSAVAFVLFIRIRERNLRIEKRILEEKVRQRTAEIEKQKLEIMHQRDEIAEQKKNITDSIHYASRIQSALLPSEEILRQYLPEHFILWRPRDIVSGDFYWMTSRGDETVVLAADCTGHGVPGAFMSMLGVAFLNEIINRNNVLKANEILDQMREYVIKSLHQTGKEGESKDGMDMALCIINHTSNKLQFAGAYNSAYLIRNKELTEIKADRMPIGYSLKNDQPFTLNNIDLQEGDQFYIYSDGFSDQFGGDDARKFMSKKFKELLLQSCHLPMEEQKQNLLKAHLQWRGTKYEQIDDILVIGIKI